MTEGIIWGKSRWKQPRINCFHTRELAAALFITFPRRKSNAGDSFLLPQLHLLAGPRTELLIFVAPSEIDLSKNVSSFRGPNSDVFVKVNLSVCQPIVVWHRDRKWLLIGFHMIRGGN